MKWKKLFSGAVRGRLRVRVRLSLARTATVVDQSADSIHEEIIDSQPENEQSNATSQKHTAPLLNIPGARSYYGDSPAAAMRRALVELGKNALVLGINATQGVQQYRGRYEVLCGNPLVEATGDISDAPVVSQDLQESKPGDFAHILRELGAPTFNPVSGMSAQQADVLATTDEARRSLIRQDITAPLAWDVLERVRTALSESDNNITEIEVWREVRAELRQRIRSDATLWCDGIRNRVVALVGPPGAGKSAAIRKLAARAGELGARGVMVLALTETANQSSEQVSASAMEKFVEFSVPSIAMLDTLLQQISGADIIFIDTPGYGKAADMELLSRFLESHQDIDVHLTVPLTFSGPEMTGWVDLFELLRPDKLLFTMADRSDTADLLCREAGRTGKPVSFITWTATKGLGLLPADADVIVDKLVAACTKHRKDLSKSGSIEHISTLR